VDARDRHVVAERDLGVVHQPFDRRGAGRLRRAGERDVAFAGQQARSGIEPDPAGARQVDLAPGVQVGEIDRGAARAVQRLHVGRQLDQVAGNEPRRQAEAAQQLHHQPARVAAGAAGQLQCFLRRLHPGLHADQVLDVVLQLLVDRHQEVDGGARRAVDLLQVVLHQRRERLHRQVGRQFLRHLRLVLERELLGARLQEKVERVVHRHFDHHVHRHLEFGGGFGEHQPGLVVGERVLLPVDEVVGRLDPQRIGDDLAAAMRRGPQSHHLGPQVHRPVVFVVGDVVEGGMDGHAAS
jgi:hypothetical protein